MVNVPPGLSFDVSVPLKAQRTWQRKWRDVLHDRNAIAETYQGDRIDVDDFTRRVEGFFKTCRELADWIEESTQLPAMDYARTPPRSNCAMPWRRPRSTTPASRQSGTQSQPSWSSCSATQPEFTPTSRGEATSVRAGDKTRWHSLTYASPSGKSSFSNTISIPAPDRATPSPVAYG